MLKFEKGKFVEVKKGNPYLGREVRNIGEPGLSNVEEVKEILRELEEYIKHGIPSKKIHSRTYVLFTAVPKSKKMSKEEKLKAIEAINKFRKKMGWKPFEPKNHYKTVAMVKPLQPVRSSNTFIPLLR